MNFATYAIIGIALVMIAICCTALLACIDEIKEINKRLDTMRRSLQSTQKLLRDEMEHNNEGFQTVANIMGNEADSHDALEDVVNSHTNKIADLFCIVDRLMKENYHEKNSKNC